MKKFRSALLIFICLLAGCGKSTPVIPATSTSSPATATLAPTETSIPATATSIPPTATETSLPVATQDPTIFGAMGTNEIQASAIESVANAIFTKTLDGFVTSGSIQEYQVTNISVFPGSNGLLAEIIYNVKTADVSWLSDGGSQTADGWINGNCSRFDFFSTETEYQLKNRRLCS